MAVGGGGVSSQAFLTGPSDQSEPSGERLLMAQESETHTGGNDEESGRGGFMNQSVKCLKGDLDSQTPRSVSAFHRGPSRSYWLIETLEAEITVD